MAELRPSVNANGTEMFYSAGRSFGDISSATMFQDMDKLMLGGVLMFVYMEIVLSKFGWTEIRVKYYYLMFTNELNILIFVLDAIRRLGIIERWYGLRVVHRTVLDVWCSIRPGSYFTAVSIDGSRCGRHLCHDVLLASGGVHEYGLFHSGKGGPHDETRRLIDYSHFDYGRCCLSYWCFDSKSIPK